MRSCTLPFLWTPASVEETVKLYGRQRGSSTKSPWGDGHRRWKLWEVASENDCGVLVFGAYYSIEGDLLLKGDNSILIPKEELGVWYFQTTNFITTEDNKLEVWLYDGDGNQIERIFFSDTGKKAPRLLEKFFRSSVNGPARYNSVLDSERFTGVVDTGSTYAIVDVIYAQIYENPLVSTLEYTELPGGSILMVNTDVRLTVSDVTFVAVRKSDLGEGGWVDLRAIRVEDREDIYPAANTYLAERDGES